MVRNLSFIRSLPDGISMQELGARLYEAFSGLDSDLDNITQQTNSNRTGQPPAPPNVQGLKVQAQNGHFQVSIQDNGESLYRGVSYFLEHADNPHFINPHVVEMGTGRNANLYLGNVTRYFRAYSAYRGSGPGNPVYHGGAGQPAAVQGGGTDPGPAFLEGEGSGTGIRQTGLGGPGPTPFRSATGAAPVR